MGENFPNSAITFFKLFIAFISSDFFLFNRQVHALFGLVHQRASTSLFPAITLHLGVALAEEEVVKSIVLLIVTTKVPKAPFISSASPHVFFQLAVFLHKPVTVEQLWICGTIVNSILYLFFNLRWRFKYSCGEVIRRIDLPAIVWHRWRRNQSGDWGWEHRTGKFKGCTSEPHSVRDD